MGSGLVAEFCLGWLIDRYLDDTTEVAVKQVILDELVNVIGDMRCEPARAAAAVKHFHWKKYVYRE